MARVAAAVQAAAVTADLVAQAAPVKNLTLPMARVAAVARVRARQDPIPLVAAPRQAPMAAVRAARAAL